MKERQRGQSRVILLSKIPLIYPRGVVMVTVKSR